MHRPHQRSPAKRVAAFILSTQWPTNPRLLTYSRLVGRGAVGYQGLPEELTPVQRAQRGDEEAFAMLFQVHNRRGLLRLPADARRR
jgi:hypothetical protein